MYGNLFKQSPVDGHSGCLQSSVIINCAAVNSLVHPTLHTYMQLCLWNTFHSSRLSGSTGTCIEHFDRECQIAIHGDCANLYSHPPLGAWVSLHSGQFCVWSNILIFVSPVGRKDISLSFAFVFVFIKTKVEQFFCMLRGWISSSENCVFASFTHFFLLDLLAFFPNWVVTTLVSWFNSCLLVYFL